MTKRCFFALSLLPTISLFFCITNSSVAYGGPPDLVIQAELKSQSSERREAALARARQERQQVILQATKVLEAWERTRTEPTIDCPARPSEYIALRLLVEERADESLPLLLRNISVRDRAAGSENEGLDTELRSLDTRYPFLSAAVEIGAPYVAWLRSVQATSDPVAIQLYVIGLRKTLREKLALAALDEQIERATAERSTGTDSLRLARIFAANPRVLFHLYPDIEKK